MSTVIHLQPQPYTEGELWKLVEIEGKGVGAVAKTYIKKGSDYIRKQSENSFG